MEAITRSLRRRLPAQPAATSYARVGAMVTGGIGAIAGLLIGLDVYAPTAWFAVSEIGVPAAIAGGLLGFVSGGTAAALQRWKQRETR